jgi:hypothetical protein
MNGDFKQTVYFLAAELLFATCIRIVELAALPDEDIDLAAGAITITGIPSAATATASAASTSPDSEIRFSPPTKPARSRF